MKTNNPASAACAALNMLNTTSAERARKEVADIKKGYWQIVYDAAVIEAEVTKAVDAARSALKIAITQALRISDITFEPEG